MLFKKMKDLKWVRSNHKLDWPMMGMLSISLFLVATADNKAVWILFAIFMGFGLINNPKLIFSAIFLFVISMLVNSFLLQTSVAGELSGEFKVVRTTAIGPVIKYKGNYVVLNYFGNIHKGETILVTGVITIPESTENFDLKTYLRSMNIANIVQYPKIELLEQSTYFLNKFLLSLELGSDNYSMIAPLLLLGSNSGSSRVIYDTALEMNVVHLFVISGFHISLMYMGIRKLIMSKTKNEYFADTVSFLIPVFYLFILDFSLSSTRAILLIAFSIINNHWLNQRFTSLERLSSVCMLMFIVKPWTIYSLSFIFSFIATFAIGYVNTLKISDVDKKQFLIFVAAYLSTLPVSIYTNGYISVFGLLFGIGLTPLFAVYYVLTLVFFPFPAMLNIFYIPFIYMINITSYLNVMIPNVEISLYNAQAFYLLLATCLIINKLWNLFTEKNHSLLKENWNLS